MKYYEKHVMIELDKVLDDGMVRVSGLAQCWSCGDYTSWICTEMGEVVCSEECRKHLHTIVGNGETRWLQRVRMGVDPFGDIPI